MMKRKALLISAAVFGVAATNLCGAAAADMTNSSASAIETVIVTAQKRAEPLQKAPLSVTALSSADIQRLHPHDLADINHTAPNFTIEGAGALFRNAAVVFARGIGYDNVDATLDPRVEVTVDGVPYLRNTGSLQDIFDLSSIEVLLGPQGTLYGKNAVGGVVNIVTQKPTEDYEFDGMLRYGNFGRLDYELVGNLPIADDLAVRISFQSQYSDGPYLNSYVAPTGLLSVDRHLGGDDTKTIRGSVRWTPTQDLQFDLITTYLHNTSPSVGGTNASSPTDLLSTIIGHPGYGFPGGPRNPFITSRSWPSADYFDLLNVTLNGRYHTQWFDVVSVTGYINDGNPEDYNDFSNAGIDFFETYAVLHHNQFTQEVRLESNDRGPLRWTAGVYYDTSYYNYWTAVYPYFLGYFGSPGLVESEWTLQHEHSISGFGQLDYDLTDQLTLTAGGRLLDEHKSFVQNPSLIGTAPTHTFPVGWALDAARGWSAFTYKLAAKYQFTPDMMGYVSYSTGFKSGGYNSGATSTANLGPFEPETSRAWEVGLKTEWYDNRLTANLAAFWNNYDRLQEETYIPSPIGTTLLTAISNSAYELARGVELSSTAIPVDDLQVTTAIGYLDAHYTNFYTDLFGTGIAGNYAYLHPEHSPQWTMRIDAAYTIPLAWGGSLVPDVSYAYQSSYYTDLANSVQGFNPSYGLLDASVAYNDPSGKWQLSAWGKNLTNQLYVLNAVPVAGLFTPVYFGNPRTFGVDLRLKLGGSPL